MSVSQQFGPRLRELRIREGWSLRKFAGKVHYSAGYLSKIENGLRPASYDLACACDRVLGSGSTVADMFVATQRTDDAAASSTPLPAQLPRDVRGFVGRGTELAALTTFGRAGAGSGVAMICGAPGVGKTALAVHFAHRGAHRFPDGQLYVNLRGSDPERAALSATEVLRRLLIALGVAPHTMPANLDDRASLYRSLLAGKRVLVLLDDACGTAHVRPALPGNAECLVLITGRVRLPGLAVRDGAQHVTLDELPPADSLALLSSVLGEARVAREHAAARELAAACAHLPLALRTAAVSLLERRQRPIADLVAELHNGRPLEVLRTGEHDLADALNECYARLGAAERRMLRLLAAYPQPDSTPDVAAALADVERRNAEHSLRALVEVCLLTEVGPSYYRLRGGPRWLAERALAEEEPEEAQTEARRRLRDWQQRAKQSTLQLTRTIGRAHA